MTLDFADFTKASNIIHALQGASLLLLGAAEAYSLDNSGKKATLAAAAGLVLAGLAMFAAVLALPGGWSFRQLGEALAFRRGFYLFIAFACLYGAAGLSLFAAAAVENSRGGWQKVFLGLLAFSGSLYFLMAWRVNEEAWRQVLVWHSAIGVTLLLAVAARAAYFFRERRGLRLAWALLLLAAGLQLVSYKESSEAFSARTVTIESAPEQPAPAANNAKPADKERTAD